MIKQILVIGALSLTSAAAQAQTIGIGTFKGGATGQVTAAISTVVSRHAGLTMRPQPMSGPSQYIPAVNAGSLEFGVSSIMQLSWAYNGVSLSKGRPNRNLRVVATLMQFRVGPLVAAGSPIKTIADIKGKRLPARFTAAPLFQEFMYAFLANGGYTMKDIKPVPVSVLKQSWDALIERKLDVVQQAIGVGYLNLMANKIGGVRFIDLDDSPKGLAAMRKFLPGATIKTVTPGPKLIGVTKPVKLLHYDYMVFAGKNVSDGIVYKVTKTLYEHRTELVGSSPLWRSFMPANMGKDHGIPIHPGAAKFLKEKGALKH